MENLPVVELKTAFHWICESCSHDNFALPRKAELTDEQAEEAYRKYHSLEPYIKLPEDWRDFEIVQIPDVVTCSLCCDSFRTVNEANG